MQQVKFVDVINIDEVLKDLKRINAIHQLSVALLKINGTDEVSANAKALGFNFRKSNLDRLSTNYSGQNRFGRGIVFQVAPRNTPVSSLYGAIYSFLSGNVILTRVSEHSINEISPITDIMDMIEYKGKPLSNYMKFITYPSSQIEISKKISYVVDVRILWGGDQTVNDLKSYTTNPACIDIAFPDKYSILIINSDYICNVNDEKINYLSHELIKDLLTFDHDACSSPKVIVWIGLNEVSDKAKLRLIGALNTQIINNKIQWGFAAQREIQAAHIKFTGKYSLISKYSGIINFYKKNDNMHDIDFKLFKNGNILESYLNKINDISIYSSKKLQTCTYIGFDGNDISDVRSDLQLFGFDRIVPVGKALDMSEIWDGIDFFESLTKKYIIV